MRLILFLYLSFYGLNLSAESDIETLTHLLTDWDPNSLARVQQLEELSFRTKSKEVSLRLALILAFTPEANLKVKPYVYANFALQHRKELQIDDLFSLYRIAGDGHYQDSDFRKAHKIYNTAIADKLIENKDREYFVYKNAWALLNLKQPRAAYQALKQWLEKNEPSFLRPPMMVDLGRSWGEAVFEKSKLISTADLYKPKSELESQQIVEGLLKSLQRSPTQIDLFYKIYFAQNSASATLATVFEHPLIQKKGPCEIMNMKKFMQAQQMKIVLILPKLNECSVSLLQATSKISNQAYNEVADWMQFFELDVLQQWTVVRLLGQAKQLPKACDASFKMVPQILKTRPEWTSEWSKDLIRDCQKGISGNSFEQKILEQAAAWKTLHLQESLMALNSLSLDTKKSLLQAWFENQPPKTETDQQLLLLALSGKPEQNQKTLEELCPPTEIRCTLLWTQQLIQSPQILKNIIDQDGFLQKPNSPLFNFITTYKEFLNDRENKTLSPPKTPIEFKNSQLNVDVETLMEITNYRQKIILENIENEKTAIEALAVFQQQSSITGKHKWFSRAALNKAQYEISQVALHIKNQISALGKTKEEKKQWQLIAKTLNKWVLR